MLKYFFYFPAGYRMTSSYMAVLFWYLDLSNVRYCTEACTSVAFYKVHEQQGHVYLVALYLLYLQCTLACNKFF